MASEPSEPFDFDAIDERERSAQVEPAPTFDLRLLSVVLGKYVSQLVATEAGARSYKTIGRKVVAHAFMFGVLGKATQQQLGEALGYPPETARQCFHSLLKREALTLGLPPSLGPGRSPKRGRRKRA